MKHARKDYDRIQDPAGLIPEDEPVFLLRGQDVLAPSILRRYADHYLRRGGDEAVAKDVLRHAQAMEDWPVKKLADYPPTIAEPEAPPRIVEEIQEQAARDAGEIEEDESLPEGGKA